MGIEGYRFYGGPQMGVNGLGWVWRGPWNLSRGLRGYERSGMGMEDLGEPGTGVESLG